MKLNMLPSFISNYARNRGPVHVEQSCDGLLQHALLVQLANGANIGFRQLGVGISFTILVVRRALYPATFANHVLNIVARCTNEQVTGAYTEAVIANVADKQLARRYRAVQQFVHKAMGCKPMLPVYETAIASRGYSPAPKPTISTGGASINLREEAFNNLRCGIIRVHFLNLLYRFGDAVPKDVHASLRLCCASIIPHLSVGGV